MKTSVKFKELNYKDLVALAISSQNKEIYFGCLEELKNILESETLDKVGVLNILEGLKEISISIDPKNYINKKNVGLKSIEIIKNSIIKDFYFSDNTNKILTLKAIAKESEIGEIFMSAIDNISKLSKDVNVLRQVFLYLIYEAKSVKCSIATLDYYEKLIDDQPLKLISDLSFIFKNKRDKKIIQKAFLILIKKGLITEENFKDIKNIELLFSL